MLLWKPLPGGPVHSIAVPARPAGGIGQSQSSGTILGWTTQPAGVLVAQAQADAQENPAALSVYFVPLATGMPARPVETIRGGPVAVAPLTS